MQGYAMPGYRAYVVDHDGHIKSSEPLVCKDEDTAIARVKRLVDGYDVELWQGTRRVTKLPCKADSNKTG
jgi:hypothetical protein